MWLFKLTDAHIVEWSPKGEKYVVVILNKIDIYQLDTASVSGTITNEKRISSITFFSVSYHKSVMTFMKMVRTANDILNISFFSQDSVLAVAGDEELVRFFDCDSLMCLCEFKAHENR
jgi:protein MAK11